MLLQAQYVLVAVSFLGAAAPVPTSQSLLPSQPLERVQAVDNDQTMIRRVRVTGQPFREAVRVETKKRPDKPYHLQVRIPSTGPVAQGNALLASFFVRGLSKAAETGEATLTVVFERAAAPYEKSLHATMQVGRQWQELRIPFRAGQSLAAGQAQLTFQLGYDPQFVEIGGVSLRNYGKIEPKTLPAKLPSYAGRQADAAWRKAAAERIERHRKGNLVVKVLDAQGQPVDGAEVRVTMTRHAFGWGSAVTADLLAAETDDGNKYRDIVRQWYNKVVFENDLKWHGWDNTGHRPKVFDAIRWLQEAGIAIRGHCLVWPSWRYLPRSLEKLASDPATLRQRVDQHVRDEAGALRGKLVEWDVINEPYTNHDLMDVLGKEAMVQWFRAARAVDPEVRLYLNDYAILSAGGRDTKHQDHYEQTLRYLLDQGAPLGGIGMQGHFGQDLTPPDRLIKILDRFAQFNLPIQVTEHDIDLSDEGLQADYTRDFLTTMFSHPSVVGVLSWGFWEGRHWKPQGAYFRKDWSLKPAGEVWQDLVLKQWWTRETATTAATGQIEVRGFLGQYEIVVRRGSLETKTHVTLPSEGVTTEVRLK